MRPASSSWIQRNAESARACRRCRSARRPVALHARQRGDGRRGAVDREERGAGGVREVQRTGGVRLRQRTGGEQDFASSVSVGAIVAPAVFGPIDEDRSVVGFWIGPAGCTAVNVRGGRERVAAQRGDVRRAVRRGRAGRWSSRRRSRAERRRRRRGRGTARRSRVVEVLEQAAGVVAPPLPAITTVYLALVASCGIGQARPASAAELDGAPVVRTIAVYAVVGSEKNSDGLAVGHVGRARAAGGGAAGAGRLVSRRRCCCPDRASR